MRPRSLLILTLVVAALGAFIWFFERKQPTTDEAKAQEKKVLGDLEAGDVAEVTIAREGTSIRLVREGGAAKPADEKAKAADADEMPAFEPPAEWRIAAPLAARADRTAIDGLLSSLLSIEKARTFETADRKKYGLAPPLAQVTLVTSKGKRTLEVGDELAGTDQRAVALAGEPAVEIVAGGFWNEITRAAGDWRSKELFAGTRDDVERVTLVHGGNRILLARRGGEPWLEAPLADRADPERFDQLVDALVGLSAVEFVDDPNPLLTLGLEPPADVLEVVRKVDGKVQPKPWRLELGATSGEGEAAVRYARADGQLVTVTAPAIGEAAARRADEWRSRAWTGFAVYDVDRLEIRDGKGPLVLTRDESDWKRGDVKIFYGTVSDLLGALADARADRVVDGPEAKALSGWPPVLTIDIVGAGGKKQTLTLWAAAAGGAAARTSGRDAILLMPAALPADLAAKLQAIRKAEALKEEPSPTPSP